jgi:hypothetical protein
LPNADMNKRAVDPLDVMREAGEAAAAVIAPRGAATVPDTPAEQPSKVPPAPAPTGPRAIRKAAQRGGVIGVVLWIVFAIFVIGLLVVIGTGKLLF